MTGVLQHPLRMLSTEVLIRTNSPALFDRLGYITPRAEQGLPVAHRATIEVMWAGGAFHVNGAGGTDDAIAALPNAFDALAARVMQVALAAFPRAILIHAASLRHGGRMVLLVGGKRAGKTTLAAHLMLDGFDVAGDELVLLEDGIATPVPRPFYLRAAAIALVPGLGEACRTAPFTLSPTEGRLIAVDPSMIGRRWHVGPAPVSVCYAIEPRHGADSAILPCSSLDLVRLVLPHCLPPADPAQAWVTDLCRMVTAARSGILRLGSLASATVALRNTIL